MNLFFITNNPEEASKCEAARIDWVFLDLEIYGKEKRQENRNTVISKHSVEDIPKLKSNICKSKLMVRINPPGNWTKNEVLECDNLGADMIMLPYFKTAEEVQSFIKIKTQAKKCLLLETMDAVYNIDNILKLKNIDYIHIGLNDLNIERGTKFLFEFLADGWLEILGNKLNNSKIQWGFGGIGAMESLKPKGRELLTEHIRLGSKGVILSRSFKSACTIDETLNLELLKKEIKNLRRTRDEIIRMDDLILLKNREEVVKAIREQTRE